MTRTLVTAVAAAVAALTLAGCSSDGEPSGASPAPSASPSTSPSSTPGIFEESDLTASAEPDPAGDPIEFFSSGRSCTTDPGPDLLMSEEIEVSRPVAVDDAQLQLATPDIGLGRATYVALPKGEVPLTGSWIGTAPDESVRDRVGWSERKRLVGADLEPGRYYVYFPLEITGNAGYDGIAIDWSDESGSGTSVWNSRDRYRKDCG